MKGCTPADFRQLPVTWKKQDHALVSHPLNVSIRFKLFFMHGFGLGSWSQVDVGFSAAPRATLLFSDLPEIENALPEIETELPEIETTMN